MGQELDGARTSLGGRSGPALVAALIVPLVLVPSFPQLMFHWDEFQLSYGVLDFDLTRHHPHPPGYFLFVMLGRVVRPLVGGDPTLALRVVAVLASASFAAMVAWRIPLSLRPVERWLLALSAGAFAALSPLLYLFGMAALTYTSEGAALLGLLLAISSRPEGRWRWLLVYAIGLAGGVRQTVVIWGTLIMLIEMIRHRDWVAWRDLPGLVLFGAMGLATWLVPLLIGVGGLDAYREATRALTVGNIWTKSIVEQGWSRVWWVRVPDMLQDLWTGGGLFVLLALGVLVARALTRDERLIRLDPLVMGGALAYLFYTLLIYDTKGYMIACLMPLAAYAILGTAALVELGSEREEVRDTSRTLASGLPLLCAILFPVLPREQAPGGNHYGIYAHHDSYAGARIDAISRHFDPRETVLVTSEEFWDWGLRHVGHSLADFTTIQLEVDPFFAIRTTERPYLTTRGKQIWTTGPDGFDAETLLPEGAGPLRHVVYVIPHDVKSYIHPSCIPVVGAVQVTDDEMLAVIDVDEEVRVFIAGEQLVCALAPGREPARPRVYGRN